MAQGDAEEADTAAAARRGPGPGTGIGPHHFKPSDDYQQMVQGDGEAANAAAVGTGKEAGLNHSEPSEDSIPSGLHFPNSAPLQDPPSLSPLLPYAESFTEEIMKDPLVKNMLANDDDAFLANLLGESGPGTGAGASSGNATICTNFRISNLEHNPPPHSVTAGHAFDSEGAGSTNSTMSSFEHSLRRFNNGPEIVEAEDERPPLQDVTAGQVADPVQLVNDHPLPAHHVSVANGSVHSQGKLTVPDFFNGDASSLGSELHQFLTLQHLKDAVDRHLGWLSPALASGILMNASSLAVQPSWIDEKEAKGEEAILVLSDEKYRMLETVRSTRFYTSGDRPLKERDQGCLKFGHMVIRRHLYGDDKWAFKRFSLENDTSFHVLQWLARKETSVSQPEMEKATGNKEDYSIKNCVERLMMIQTLTDREKADGVEIFRSQESREIFMSITQEAVLLMWVRSRICTSVPLFEDL